VSKALHKHSDLILQRLMALHPKLIDLSLGRVIALLEKLGDPQNHLPPVVHVAGTNAKGSVIAYMRAALEAGGYIVHVHISPHLVRFNERIRLSGSLITETALSELLEGCEKINADNPITFFEITTCAALVAFASEPADVVLLETGLGGRLDATNVIRQPAVTVLTPISFDHQQYLGNTLSQIGREKAGILKQGTPCVVATQPDGAMQSIIAKAQDLGVALYRQEEDWSVHQDGDQLVYENPRGRTILPLPNLVGRHQLNNAGIALAALDRLAACKTSEEARRFGLLGAEWPGRMQRLVKGPLLNQLPDDWEIWVDGGHNEAAAGAIAGQTHVWQKENASMPLYAIFGMLNSKNPEAFLRPLKGHIESIRCVAIPGEENSYKPDDLLIAAQNTGILAIKSDTVEKAALDFFACSQRPARILICGSLYLVGTILANHK
jgi:dihydrofolate synthase/folylpolyglutamate synthase